MKTDLWQRPTFVYTAWRGDVPLYVGCTFDLKARMSGHRADAQIYTRPDYPHWSDAMTFMEVTRYPNRYLAREAEANRIFELRPTFNCQHNPDFWNETCQPGPELTVHDRKRDALADIARQERAA